MKTQANHNASKIQIANVLKQSLMCVILLSFFRCAPLSSEMQSARLVGKSQVEITPGYSSIQFARSVNAEERKTESVGKLAGMQIAYGLSKKVDLRFRFEHFEYKGLTANVYSFGPKVSLIKDRVALYVPLWFINNTPAQLQPTMLFTVPIIGNKIDFNPSVKSILSLGDMLLQPV